MVTRRGNAGTFSAFIHYVASVPAELYRHTLVPSINFCNFIQQRLWLAIYKYGQLVKPCPLAELIFVVPTHKKAIMDTVSHSKIRKMSPQLLVADIDCSLEFYTKKLGFTIDFRYEDFYSGISKEGFSIHLKVGKTLIRERQNKRDNEDLDIVFSVEGIEDLYEEISSRSVEFVQPLRAMDYGKEFYVADPDGNIIAFLEET